MKFNFEPSQICAMDETHVWQYMVGATTVTMKGSQDVVFKSIGYEKVRVSVCRLGYYCLSRWSEVDAIYHLQRCETQSQPVK